jgi:monoamine oxidase
VEHLAVPVRLVERLGRGPAAQRFKDASGDQVLDLALASLASALALPRKSVEEQLLGWHLHDWSKDHFSRGAYSYVLSGGLDAHKALARPLENTLYFAGEATAGTGSTRPWKRGAVRMARRERDSGLIVPLTGHSLR